MATDRQIEEFQPAPPPDANAFPALDRGQEETPMSSDVLQRLIATQAVTIDQLADLLNLQTQSIYPYLSHRDLRYTQLRILIRRSDNVAIARAFLNDLLVGGGWCVTHLPADIDVDGDGDVDTDDALASTISGLRGLTSFLEKIQELARVGDINEDDVETLEVLATNAMQGIASAKQIAGFIREHQQRGGRRRKARPIATPTARTHEILGTLRSPAFDDAHEKEVAHG